VWQTVAEQLANREMPPKDKPQPTLAEKERLEKWVQGVLDEIALAHAGDPGPVVLRRLSNAQYTYTIRDLTGVDIRPTKEFPVDPANEAGFDNSGESLTMSPALLKKYLEAARHVTVAERLLDKDLKQEAGRELDAAIKLNPSSPQTKFAVARLSLAVGRTDAAATVLESIPANTVSPSQMNLLRGKVLCAQGKWDPAIALLTDAVKLNPQPAEAWYSLGRAYEHLNQLAKATEAYRKAFESTDIGRKLRQD